MGSGYTREIVENKKWISEDEFLDAIALIMVYQDPWQLIRLTYAGYRMAGTMGAIGVLATAAFLLI